MTSINRFAHIILIIVLMGGLFLIYNISESRPESVRSLSSTTSKREYMETGQVDAEDIPPRVWLLGDSADGQEIYNNVRQLCEDIQLTVAGEGKLNLDEATEKDLIIFCDPSISRFVDPAELEEFVAGGGLVILAAGLGEEESDVWPMFGLEEMSQGDDFHYLSFEKPLLPVQPETAWYDGNSGSVRMKVSSDADVYIRVVGEADVPVLYTYEWQKGRVCVINGRFLSDIRCMGLLTGAMTAVLPDFIYPILGVKAVFLDHFPMLTPADDEMCQRLYGYSAQGFIRDVLWPAFQGLSLRTNTPYTSGILAVASSDESFETADDAVFTTICKSALRFGGDLVYTANCPEDGKFVFHQDFIDRFSAIFTNYTVGGIAMGTDNFSPEMLDVPGADIRSVRGMLWSRDTRLSWEDGRTVFPAATAGNSMDDGNLFALYSVLGAYGMVSHVFDVGGLITRDGNTAAWDLDRLQFGLFESAILSLAPWLEGRTLVQTEDDVRSYREMDYGWSRNGDRMELTCSGAVKGQAFFFHTDDRIVDAKGLTYKELGNGYYLLRARENHGMITLEEGLEGR